ncbi:MAG: hypothetical protein ACREDR_35060, partial [Blastocatellia bacterium]
MTSQEEAPEQSRAGRGRPKGSGSSRVESQIYVEYVAHQIPIHPVEEFLEPGEPVAQFLKRTGGFRIELR